MHVTSCQSHICRFAAVTDLWIFVAIQRETDWKIVVVVAAAKALPVHQRARFFLYLRISEAAKNLNCDVRRRNARKVVLLKRCFCRMDVLCTGSILDRGWRFLQANAFTVSAVVVLCERVRCRLSKIVLRQKCSRLSKCPRFKRSFSLTRLSTLWRHSGFMLDGKTAIGSRLLILMIFFGGQFISARVMDRPFANCILSGFLTYYLWSFAILLFFLDLLLLLLIFLIAMTIIGPLLLYFIDRISCLWR